MNGVRGKNVHFCQDDPLSNEYRHIHNNKMCKREVLSIAIIPSKEKKAKKEIENGQAFSLHTVSLISHISLTSTIKMGMRGG